MMEDPLPHPLTRAPLLGPPVGTGLALGVPIREAAAAAVAVFGPRSLSHWKRSSGQSWRQRLGLSVEEPQSSQL